MGTVPTPAQQVASTPVPAATVNSQGNLATYLAGRTEAGGSRRPLCRVRQTIAQTIPNSGFTALLFDTEDIDYDSGHSTTVNTSRYTAQTQGWYWISYNTTFAANATGTRQAKLYLNGTTELPGTYQEQGVNSGTTQTNIAGAALIFLTVGDYVELLALQNAGGSLNTVANAFSQSSICIWLASV